MRTKLPKILEAARQQFNGYESPIGERFSAFEIRIGKQLLRAIASDGSDWVESGLKLPAWEHVSVSLGHRCPTWQEMSFVKDLFWDEEETVIQFHPPKSDYINVHPHCLHLWKPIGLKLPRPPSSTVGPQ